MNKFLRSPAIILIGGLTWLVGCGLKAEGPRPGDGQGDPLAYEQNNAYSPKLRQLQSIAQNAAAVFAQVDSKLSHPSREAAVSLPPGIADIPLGPEAEVPSLPRATGILGSDIQEGPVRSLAILQETLAELGAAHPLGPSDESIITWQSLSGARLLHRPVQVLMKQNPAELIVQFELRETVRSFVIAAAQDEAWDDYRINLDSLSVLSQELSQEENSAAESTPKIRGSLHLSIQGQQASLDAANLSWRNETYGLMVENMVMTMDLKRNAVLTLELKGLLQPQSDAPFQEVHLEAIKGLGHHLEFKVD